MGYAGLIPHVIGAAVSPLPYNPDTNPLDAIAQEVRDTSKSMAYVRSLEAKLQGKKPGDPNTSNQDWEMLSRMKKDLGMTVDYKTETEKREEQRAADAGWDPTKNRPIKP